MILYAGKSMPFYYIFIILFFAVFLPAFVEAGAAKNLVLDCLPTFFCGASVFYKRHRCRTYKLLE